MGKHKRVIAITQARSGSTRLPDKIFLKIGNKSLLEIHIERLKRSKKIDQIIIATTTNEKDGRVVQLAKQLGVASFRGSENDVLDRFYQASKELMPDFVVRVTSDCPLIDPQVVDNVVDAAIQHRVDYCANILKETFPDGQDVEVFTFDALQTAWKEASVQSDREHVTPYIRNNSDMKGGSIFKAFSIEADLPFADIRMTVDEQPDFEVINAVVDALGTDKSWTEYAAYLRNARQITAKNAHIVRNEGYLKSLEND